ncbi:MAG: pilus assembly protein HicB, partial [Duncaniella sp.]|nr:pilus assembly protein HicB [Duncaniella sp.]
MIANIVVEQTKEGDFSCFIEEDIPYLGLLGYGSSSEEAINSLIDFYNQSKEELRAEGKIVPELNFIIHYDMP